jgi:2-hydroxy-6-oxonona-2,4-dienedioate hydrolase
LQRSRTLRVDGRSIHYCEMDGSEAGGLPLLLIHGLSCGWQMWNPLLRELSRLPGCPRALAPDLPAHGRTPSLGHTPTIPELADWTARFMDAAGVERAHVVGHSMGCQVALALAHRHPRRVGGLALIGPTTGERHASTLRNAVGLMADSLREPPRYNWTLSCLFWKLGPRRYLETVRRMQADDAFSHAAEIKAPVLVIQGARDAIVPKDVAQNLAHKLRRGEYVMIPGVAHAAQWQKPGETLRVMMDFFERVRD